MSINVISNKDATQYSIRIIVDQSVDQLFTIKAAIELRNKLEFEISKYQVMVECKGIE